MSNPSSPPSSPPQPPTPPPSSPPPSSPPPPPVVEFPPIDPTNFDLIIIGTSLPSAVVSAAASSAGKTVLHLDPNPFYGSLFTSISPHSLSSLLHPTRRLISAVDLPPLPPHLHALAGKFFLDVAGPRVLFSADASIDLLVKSGVSDYMEFKAVDESLIFDVDSRRLISVPDSRAAIFKDKSLSLKEKNQLMKLFKLVQLHLSGDDDDARISEEDLETPFFEFLSKMLLPKKIIGIILYAIALADYDQENIEAGEDLLRTKDGIDRLALYHSSIGRFPNANGAMLYPMYGQGELPQAFCRRAAVKGCIYVLRMPVEALLTDEGTGLYRGVRLTSGQDIFSQKLIMDPDVVVSQALASSTPENSERTFTHPVAQDVEKTVAGDLKKVSRAICITKTSLKPDASNLLIVFPPRSLYPEQATSVRALQLSGNSVVCPVGMFVVYLSALCNDDDQGQKTLTAAIESLFRPSTADGDCEGNALESSDAPNAVHEEQKPVCEWRALYIQKITEGSIHTISTSPSPDGKLSYNDLFCTTKEMFQQMFPGEEFFPKPEDNQDGEVANPE